MKPVTAAKFKEMTGLDPQEDDLERCNCPKAGSWGHRQCGVCRKHNKPRFICGCRPKGTGNARPKES